MWTAREYAPIDTRKDNTLPDVKHLHQWCEEAAMWITNQMRTKFDRSEFSDVADMDFRTFEQAMRDALADATFDVLKKLEG